MIVLQGQNIHKHFGAQVILSGVSFQLDAGQRIGLIGRNGSGKTTILKLLLGIDSPDDGTLSLRRDVSTGYLEQHHQYEPEQTIREAAESAFSGMQQMEARMQVLQEAISSAEESTQNELLEEYSELQERFESFGGYALQARMGKVLQGLGFPEDTWDQQIGKLSGGQRNRVALARLVLSRPDLLVLDEPTNFLDWPATEWLESYLVSENISVVVVSHDRYFLNKVCTHIWDLDRTKLYSYRGNYDQSRLQKREQMESHQREVAKQKEYIRKEEAFITKHMGSQRTAEARGRRTRLQRLQRMESWTDEQVGLSFRLQPAKRGASVTLECDAMTIGHPGIELVHDLTLSVQRGEKIGIIGANGTGKTTFMKTLIGTHESLAGTMKWGPNLEFSYYDQSMVGLHEERTVYQEIYESSEQMTNEQIRSFLACFRFREEDVDKKVKTLSGGERARVLLAKLILQRPNVLLLDEPTNHLDIASRESLETALESFDGTLFVVSHDRSFLDKVVSKLVILEEGTARVVHGTYASYQTNRSVKPAELKQNTTSPVAKIDHESMRRMKREYERIEKKIMELETQQTDFQKQLELPENYMDPVRGQNLQNQIETTQNEITDLYNNLEDVEKRIVS